VKSGETQVFGFFTSSLNRLLKNSVFRGKPPDFSINNSDFRLLKVWRLQKGWTQKKA